MCIRDRYQRRVRGSSKPTHAADMLVPKANRQAVYKYLFKEGVMVAKKDFKKSKHDDPELDVPNLQVIKLMQSLKSRGFVTERFSWNWYYYYLTNEGIDYLQKFLNLPADVVPATLKKSSRPQSRPSAGGEGGKGGKGFSRGGDDGGYRRGYGDKAGAPGGEYKPSYGGGRGAAM
eukprot:TRINITY_DN26553_c0_g1_i2.p1 TRINITY_DN26553_c0_g1~~TRINITY_DN26553_c0_g1_i2.p1  ORF type:complete len:175 (-),score=51.76 TRINITY_DN26553_c0_g1_i2:47-571(-)